MRVLLQRVSSASVEIGGVPVARIGRGLLLFVGFGGGDSAGLLEPMARKIANLRVFPDPGGRFSHSLLDTGGGALLVPQFTLYGNTSKGRRPDFTTAMPPEVAAPMFNEFVCAMRALAIEDVQTGRFGADMQVSLVNEGPVTLLLRAGED